MKVNYKTSYETAVILKEWASNCGSSLPSIGALGSLAKKCQAARDRNVAEFMSGQVDVAEPTAENVLKALGPSARHIRAHTLARLAPSIIISIISNP